MNLFNYLMAKKGHNTSVRDDLFAYLLGKRTPKEVKTATGTTISISDATREKIVSLTLDKESSQDGTPTPENPVEVKTIKGYRNLFDIPNGTYTNTDTMIIEDNIGHLTVTANRTINVPTNFILKAGTYTLTNGGHVYPYFTLKSNNTNIVTLTSNDNGIKEFTIENDITIDNVAVYQTTSVYASNDFIFQITEGTEELPYVPYGTNWIYTKVSNGTDTNYYTIPLNGNEIAGIGDYKDELIVDKNGHCWLNKKMPSKNVDEISWSLDSTNMIFSALLPSDALLIRGIDFLSTICRNAGNIPTNNLQVGQGEIVSNGRFYIKDITHTSIEDFVNILSDEKIYYPLATPQLIDLNYTVDIRLFNDVNNISNSDDMDMTLKYY